MHDFKVAVRTLFHHKGTALATILTMALGIGACTAIFSVVEGVLLRPLPYPDPDRIVGVWQLNPRGNRIQTSDPNFEEWRDQAASFEAMAQFGSGITSVVGGREPVRVRAASVSRGFFRALGVDPAIGRKFAAEEQSQGGAATAIVSYGFWQRYLEGNADLGGLQLSFDNRVHTVVGVMPAGFSFPPGTEIWSPRELKARNPHRTGHNWLALGRISREATLEQAQAEMDAIGAWQLRQYADDIWLSGIELVPLREQLVGNVRTQLMVLLGAVGFLLLVACANAGNLLMAQAHARRREMAVRAALGAGTSQLVRQFLVEALTLTGLGCLLGVVLAGFGVEALLALEPGNLPRTEEVGLNPLVLGFTLLLTIVTAVVLGLFPLLGVVRRNLIDSLREGARGAAGGLSQQRIRSLIVVGEVALTIVLLVGASLLVRSFLRVLDVDPGFRTQSGLTVHLSQAFPADDSQKRQLAAFHDRLLTELKTLPGVTATGGINSLPLAGGYSDGRFLEDGPGYDISDLSIMTPEFVQSLEEAGKVGHAQFRVASEGYFPAMGIPLLQGRLPGDGDDADSPHVAVISQSLARRQWPDEDPIGKRIQFGNMDGDPTPITIIGIVGDVLDYGLESEALPTVYVFSRQRPARTASFTIVVQAGLPPNKLVGAVRTTVRRLKPELPIRVRSIEEVFSSTLAPRRFTMLLVGIFSASSLLVAAIGLFGVVAHSVSSRTREFGVRLALGARPLEVSRLVVGQGLLLGLAGLGIGVTMALGLSRYIESQLFGVSATDPTAYALVAPIMLTVVLLACYLPARRAARVDPLEALRAD